MEVRILGAIIWATPEGERQEPIVSLSNVSGVTGDSVEQEIEAIESPGGQYPELVTDVS